MKGCFLFRKRCSGVRIGTSEVSFILNVAGLFAHECCTMARMQRARSGLRFSFFVSLNILSRFCPHLQTVLMIVSEIISPIGCSGLLTLSNHN